MIKVYKEAPIKLKTTGDQSLAIPTGEHHDHNTGYSTCANGDDKRLTVTAYRPGVSTPREYQHWRACQEDNDITIFLKDHPNLTCEVGPNTHILKFTIDELQYTITVKERCSP